MSAHTERVKRELLRLRAAGRGPMSGFVPPLVREHPELAIAAVGLQDALDDLLTGSRPSPWRAAGRLLHVLDCEDADGEVWAALRSEVAAAYDAADDSQTGAVSRLLMHLDDALYELSRLSGAEHNRTG